MKSPPHIKIIIFSRCKDNGKHTNNKKIDYMIFEIQQPIKSSKAWIVNPYNIHSNNEIFTDWSTSKIMNNHTFHVKNGKVINSEDTKLRNKVE